jgi:glyoxylase-like metal-dependent hydrolase (beta-lactamase superfamily II)
MVAGDVVTISPLVRRILANNPSVMTGPGTNTYLVGSGDLAVIDPGPDDPVHLDRIEEAGAGRIRWILATHTHSDHSPGAAGLKARTGAEVIGFDRRDDFKPDVEIGDGWELNRSGFTLRAVHTPGHASNHLCFVLDDERLLFSGDHIMSGSTVVIAPPDGDMAAYLDALRRVRDIPLAAIAPGHGDTIDDPASKIEEYLTHRLARESAIAGALARAGTATLAELVEAVYTDVPAALHPIARYSVWAHLRKLAAEKRARSTDPDDPDSSWAATSADPFEQRA